MTMLLWKTTHRDIHIYPLETSHMQKHDCSNKRNHDELSVTWEGMTSHVIWCRRAVNLKRPRKFPVRRHFHLFSRKQDFVRKTCHPKGPHKRSRRPVNAKGHQVHSRTIGATSDKRRSEMLARWPSRRRPRPSRTESWTLAHL